MSKNAETSDPHARWLDGLREQVKWRNANLPAPAGYIWALDEESGDIYMTQDTPPLGFDGT